MSGLRWPLYFSLVFLSCYRSFELSHAAPHPGFGGVDVVFLGRCFVGVTTTYSLDNFSRNSHVVQVPVLVHMIGDTFWKTGSLGNARGIEPFTEQFCTVETARRLSVLEQSSSGLRKTWRPGRAWESCQIRSFPTFPPCLQLRSGIPQFLTPLECH